VHDYFDILGVSRNARAPEIRRACLRRTGPSHPDIGGEGDERDQTGSRLTGGSDLPELPDAAIDFVTMRQIVDRMRLAFFAR
jgi:curved DNA-binding protein CbpA